MKKQLNIIILLLLIIGFPRIAKSSSIDTLSFERYVYAGFYDKSLDRVIEPQSEFRESPQDTFSGTQNAEIGTAGQPPYVLMSQDAENRNAPDGALAVEVSMSAWHQEGDPPFNLEPVAFSYFILTFSSTEPIEYRAGKFCWYDYIASHAYILDESADLDIVRTGGIIDPSHILSDASDWVRTDSSAGYTYGDLQAGTYNLVMYTIGDWPVGTHGDMTIQFEAQTVPEPTTLLLLGSGILGLAGFGRKKFKKK